MCAFRSKGPLPFDQSDLADCKVGRSFLNHSSERRDCVGIGFPERSRTDLSRLLTMRSWIRALGGRGKGISGSDGTRHSSADVIAETQSLLTLLRGDRVEGCPPLLNVPAFAVRTDDPALVVLRKCQDFREFFFAGATEKIVSGHDFLPVEKALLKRILAVRPDSVNCSFSENVTENQETRDAPNQRPRRLRLNWLKATSLMR